ncbi:MAG TPA: hypothetical protein PKY71_08105 [Smithellaceae bacterium]|nr:hypothetical protein [Smithellaceae bacterium]
MLKRFPDITLDLFDTDANPAVRLFGRRFFSDQTTLELLIELLLVAVSPKKTCGEKFSNMLPPMELLKRSWIDTLDYAPRAHLNLKLFAFFGASKLDSRHETHRSQLEHLDEELKRRISVNDDTPDNIIKTLENLFLGFHGVGSQRTWCAQSFMPISTGMLAAETIWNETYASRNLPDSWNDVISQYTAYFSVNKHRFLARGGEVLYLQLCNALRIEKDDVEKWLQEKSLANFLTADERNPIWLHTSLGNALNDLMQETPATVSKLAEFIDRVVDKETARKTDGDENNLRWSKCGWCPQETWPESYLFAVEFLRVCRAKMDLMDKIEMLEALCSMQVMRSLTTQASRYQRVATSQTWPACRLAVSDPEGNNKTVKQVSRVTMQAVTKTIYDGLRHPDIFEPTPGNMREKLYNEADRRYGHKLFITIGKRIGVIVPRRGAGMRFVLTPPLLRLLIVTLLPGRRLTYDAFKLAAESHFGLAFDEASISRANTWATGVSTATFGGVTDEWLIKMLHEAGALRKLSDSCALVENTAAVDHQENIK